MRPYGLPRHPDVECPDKVDITYYGLSPTQYVDAISGRTKREKRRSLPKRHTRRRWKRAARRQGHKTIVYELRCLLETDSLDTSQLQCLLDLV